MINVGIFGATGYTGLELVQILVRHPEVDILFATSERNAGSTLRDVFPAAPDLQLISKDDAAAGDTDIVFLCLPHAAAAPTAVAALEAGSRVIDLSADFRLRDAEIYEQWYGIPHPAPALLAEAVYGLTEFVRPELLDARLVANPGCYPTSVLLAVQPVLKAGAVAGTIIADCKSGVSGAGRTPKQSTHFVEIADNFMPYKLGRAHRHLPEMEQLMGCWVEQPPQLIFSPHLLPVPRGLLSTIYIPLHPDWSEAQVYELFESSYASEPFVRLLPREELPSLSHVNHTNLCVLGLNRAHDTLIVASAVDNLVKGASGQAVQNMNLMFGFDESTGLL